MRRQIHTKAGLWLSVIAVFASAVAGGWNEASADATAVYTLGEIVITGERAGVESVSLLHEIGAEDIKQRHAETLDQAIELIPGLDVRVGGQGIPRVNLRGLRTRHTVLLLDGIPLNSTYDGQFNPSIVPLENIAKIKVSYGTHSVLYGQGGLAGIINIVTRKGKEGLAGAIAGEIRTQGQSVGRFTLSGSEGGFDFLLGGSITDSDGFPLSKSFIPTAEEDGGTRDNSDTYRRSLFLNLGFNPSDNWSVGAIIDRSDGSFGKPPSVINNKDDVFAKNPKYERVNDYNGLATQLSLGYHPDGPFSFRAWAFQNEYSEESAGYDDAQYSQIAMKGSYTADTESHIQGGAIQAGYVFGAGKLAASFSAEDHSYAAAGDEIKKKNGPLVAYSRKHSLEIRNAAIEYDVSPLPDLTLTLGYSHHWLDAEDSPGDDDGSFLFGARYALSENVAVRGSAAGRIRFPSTRQFYDPDSGNPNLTTEKSLNYEIGLSCRLPWDLAGDIAFFQSDVTDYIEKNDVDLYENHEEYRFKGLEVGIEKRLASHGHLRLGYGYLEAEDRSAGSRIDDLEYRPHHKLTMDGGYRWGFGLSGHLGVMYVADQHHYSAKGPLQKKDLNDYAIVDAKLEQNFLDDAVSVYVGAKNLFDENHEESYGYPQAGRLIYGGIRVSF